MKYIKDKTFDEERALYGESGLIIDNVRFDGPQDGESALKECADIHAKNCYFNLRYPFWHVNGVNIENCEMTEFCRAALWYCKDIAINDSNLHGIKALRECSDVRIDNTDILSPEFGWSVDNITMSNSNLIGEYLMMRSSGLRFKNITLKGKYSFQYVKDAVFDNCEFDTKDAFWHGENIVVRNSVVKGEYLGWYARNLTFINCTIIGTQPLCYCEGLELVDCKMIDTDLCFEKSSVQATILTPIVSVKNIKSGNVYAPQIGEIICDDPTAKGRVAII